MNRHVDQHLSLTARRAARALQPLGLVTILSISAAVATSLLVTAPAEEHLSRAQAEHQAARQMQQRLQAGRITLDELKEVFRLLPPRKDFSALVLAISELARQDAVKIPGMNYSLQKAEEGLALKATMTFQAAGPYPGIRAFIHRLETTGPYLFIESLDAARSPGTKADHDRTVVVFNVRVVTFLQPDPPAATSPAPADGRAI